MAAYSVGQLIASPLLGLWADRHPTRAPLMLSLSLNIVFSILYSYAGAFPRQVSTWVVLVSRALIGFGAGGANSLSLSLTSTDLCCRKCCSSEVLCL